MLPGSARVLNKFQECGFEKIERLLELRETYATRVRKAKDKFEIAEEMQEINKEASCVTLSRDALLSSHISIGDTASVIVAVRRATGDAMLWECQRYPR